MPNTDIVSACADMIVRARKLGAVGTAGTAGPELVELLPSGMTNIAIENGHRNSGFSH